MADEEVEKATEVPTAYVPSTIPAGAYEGVDHDTNTIAVSTVLAVGHPHGLAEGRTEK